MDGEEKHDTMDSLLAQISQFAKIGPCTMSGGLNKKESQRIPPMGRNSSINMNQSVRAWSQWSNNSIFDNNCVSSHSGASF
jgi:hypothetical protein